MLEFIFIGTVVEILYRDFLPFVKSKALGVLKNDCYGWAYLTTVIGNYFGDGLSLGINKYEYLDKDNWDNGVYIIEDWEIVDREFFYWDEQNEHKLEDMLVDINNHQPSQLQITKEELNKYNLENGTSLTL